MHADLSALTPKFGWNRREFVVTSLAAGFALAVQPVGAETITTAADGLEAGEVKIPVNDGEIPAYQARRRRGKTSRRSSSTPSTGAPCSTGSPTTSRSTA